MNDGLTAWERACLSRAAAHLRMSASQPDVPSLNRPTQKSARLRALRWLTIAATGPGTNA